MHYLFSGNPIVIKPTIDNKVCVLCTRGKNKRIAEIDSLLKNGCGTDDERHEVEFLRKKLAEDSKNDTSIVIPGSILVYQNDTSGKTLCEFDGLAIHPMRSLEQVLLLEAKNTATTPSSGKKCLCEKLDKLSFAYEKQDVIIDGHDAYFVVSI